MAAHPNQPLLDVEIDTPARIAEFLLGNATSPEEYADAVTEVCRRIRPR